MALRAYFLLRSYEVYLQVFLFVLGHLQVQEYFLWLEAEGSSMVHSVYFDFEFFGYYLGQLSEGKFRLD